MTTKTERYIDMLEEIHEAGDSQLDQWEIDFIENMMAVRHRTYWTENRIEKLEQIYGKVFG